MTHHPDVACSRELVARWCMLAEQRLKYLTELFESGRWRRYHSERAFLENIREAKAAVETWRSLSGRKAARPDGAAGQNRWIEPRPLAGEPPAEAGAADAAFVASDEAPSAPMVDLVALEHALKEFAAPTMDISAMERRYPLLRNSF